MATIRPFNLPPSDEVSNIDAIVVDDGIKVRKATAAQVVANAVAFADQDQAESGTNETNFMNPLRTAQAIEARTFTAETLASIAGAGLIGTESGNTVQVELADKLSASQLAEPDGAGMVGFLQSAADAQAALVSSKLKERAVSLLDFVVESLRVPVASGTEDAQEPFGAMMQAALAEGRPARVTKGNYKFSEQVTIPSGVALILEDGANLFFEDPALESLLLVEENGASVYAESGAKISGPLTNEAGLTGAAIIVRNTSGVVIAGLETQGGKYGVLAFNNDSLSLSNVTVRNTYRWGITSAGNRDSVFRNVGTIVTRDDTGAADSIKVMGKIDAASVTARSSYNLVFSNCFGVNIAGGQTIDIISTVDENDDLYNVTVTNPIGINNSGGLLEIKVDDAVPTSVNWPVHDIFVTGGSYFGTGAEPSAIYMARRVYNIIVSDTVIRDVAVGVVVANPVRHTRLRDIAVYRSRREGIIWSSGAGAGVACVIERPVIIDPNYGQAASTYSGISQTNGSHLRIIAPTVGRSSVPSGAAHLHGIQIAAACSNTMIEGECALFAQAGKTVDDAGTSTRWPVSFSVEASLAENAAQFYRGVSTLHRAFYATRISIAYTDTSNVARSIQIQGRSDASSANLGTAITTSATGVLFSRVTQNIATPVRVTVPLIVAQVQAVTLPVGPTGRVLISVEGFYDGSSAS